MLVNFNDNVLAKRVLTLRSSHWIIVQALAPNPIRLASNRIEAEFIVSAVFANDGIQVNPSVNNADIMQLRWTGELWVIAVNGAATQAVVLVPGLSAEQESLVYQASQLSTVR